MVWTFSVESVNEDIYFLKRDCKIKFNEQIRKLYYLAQLRHVLFVTYIVELIAQWNVICWCNVLWGLLVHFKPLPKYYIPWGDFTLYINGHNCHKLSVKKHTLLISINWQNSKIRHRLIESGVNYLNNIDYSMSFCI
jgi:hypothetical protein